MIKMFKQELKNVSPAEARQILEAGRICGWRDCTATCKGDLPPGWVNLLVYWSPMPVVDARRIKHWAHDKVLCPAHALALDQLLKAASASVGCVTEMPTIETASRFDLPLEELSRVADVMLRGSEDDLGWVEVRAGPRGREAIGAVFPGLPLEWHPVLDSFLPKDWRGVRLKLSTAALATPRHHLPAHLPLDKAKTPEAFAFILAIAVKSQGLTAAIMDRANNVQIIPPTVQ
jgi:hypothetical protein